MEIKTSTKHDHLLTEEQLQSLKELRAELEKNNAQYLENLKNDPSLTATQRQAKLEQFYDSFNSFVEVQANEMLKITTIRGQTKYWRAVDEPGYINSKSYSAEILSSTSYDEILTLDELRQIDVLRSKLKEEYNDRLHDFAAIDEINLACENMARKFHLQRISHCIRANKTRLDALKEVKVKQPEGVPVSRFSFDFFECIDLFKFILPQHLDEEVPSTPELKVLLEVLTNSVDKHLILEILQNVFVEKCIEDKLKWVVKSNPSKVDELLDHIYNSLATQNNAIAAIIDRDAFVHCCTHAALQSISEILELEISSGWELLSLRIHSTYVDVIDYGDYRIHAFEELTAEEEDKKWPLGRGISLVRGK